MHAWFRKATTRILILAVIVLMGDIVASTFLDPKLSTPSIANLATAEIADVATPKTVLIEYIEIIDSCGPYQVEVCVVARSGPGLSYPTALRLRSGMVLRTSEKVEAEGRTWYKIAFDEWLRYPERAGDNLYVAGDYAKPILNPGPLDLLGESSTTKRIIVDRGEQMLYAYESDQLFTKLSISTGLEFTPTPRGNFRIYKKTPSRYMQGPIPEISDQYYDLPGVPWNLYFTEQGAVIHGAYWHDKFGKPWSHGCVNLPPEEARRLYMWADLGTPVLVRD